MTLQEGVYYLVFSIASPYLLASGINKIVDPRNLAGAICATVKVENAAAIRLARCAGLTEVLAAIVACVGAVWGGELISGGEVLFLIVLTVAGAAMLYASGQCGCGLDRSIRRHKLSELSWMVVRNAFIAIALVKTSAKAHDLNDPVAIWIISISQSATWIWIVYNRLSKLRFVRTLVSIP